VKHGHQDVRQVNEGVSERQRFGDGIMSAIDFDMTIKRLPNPKGDRVKIGLPGKFLPVQILRRHRQPAGVWV
jgi:cyanate lyase